MPTTTIATTTSTTAPTNPSTTHAGGARPAPPSGPVTVPLNFFTPPPPPDRPVNYVNETKPQSEQTRNFSDEWHDVSIADIRADPEPTSSFTLDNDAFQVLVGQPPSAERDFTDDVSIRRKYYPEVRDLLKQTIPGVKRVVIFDHTIRRQKEGSPRSPVTRVHVDQTAYSAAQRVRRHLGPNADSGAPGHVEPEAINADPETLLASSRYRLINVWRPLNPHPVESFPLAIASSASVADQDVISVDHVYDSGYVGQTAGVRHAGSQKWYYFSGMTGDERLLLECFDSEALKGETAKVKGGRAPHTAFEDPRTREGADGRESIEVRALVFDA